MKKLTILAADDDATHREMLRTLLREWGYAVGEAVDGEQAVALCREQSFDLVLMDVRMPKKTGLEALKEIKAHNPALPVLIMTAFSDVAAAVEAIKSGAYDYLTKPLDFEKLKVVLRNVFAHVGLIEENASLSRSLAATEAHSDMVGRSAAMSALWEMLRTIAPTDATVLITGESGTGKELVARAIHYTSPRKDKPFVSVNCMALNPGVLESELFGHEKGSFTGAVAMRRGRFEQADGGTLFLDEIAELTPDLQVKLLRVLQERRFERVGGGEEIEVDIRVVAATNKDLWKEVREKRFREDLFFRISVLPLTLPPLRERGDDVLLLARHFLDHFCRKKARPPLGLTPDARRVLAAYTWPGNVRELENFMERLSILVDGAVVQPSDLPRKILDQVGDISALPEVEEQGAPESAAPSAQSASDAPTHTEAPRDASQSGGFVWPDLAVLEGHGLNLKDFLDAVESRLIDEALNRAGGVKNQAAEYLGIKRTTLIEKLKKRNP